MLMLLMSLMFVFLMAGCTSLIPRNCTAMGCISQLTINLTGNAPSEFRLKATGNAGEESVAQCKDGRAVDDGTPQAGSIFSRFKCSSMGVTLRRFAPDEVTLTVYWGESGVLTGIFRPAYTVLQPNGPGCSPSCRSGAVTMMLP